MKRLVWSLVITSALILAAVPEASAHGSHSRAYDRHYIVRDGHHYPYWLRRNTDFHRWYHRSRYRNDFYVSWYRLFDIYQYDRRYYRSHRSDDRYYGDRRRRDRRQH